MANNNSDIEIGEQESTLTIEDLDVREFVQYAGASGDFSRLHYDQSFAQNAGYDEVIAQGMLLAGYGSKFITDWFGIENISSYSTRFINPVEEGGSISISGEIVDKEFQKDTAVVDVEFKIKNEEGLDVVTGTATAEVPK